MDQAKIKIQELVNKYSSVLNSRSIKKYTEEETKKGFIEPLFTVLGWDISNKEEVTAEESQLQGRVDYGFYLNGRIKFYVEAKSLKADIHNEDYAKQAIRYSWNKGVDWAILTDFESLKVFYCQDPTQSLFSKLVFEIKFDEFIDRLDQLWLLSKESFNTNKLDEYAIQHGKKLQKISVGDQLYKHLNECRKLLIEKLGVWNGIKDRNLLDEGVQRLLDRLIFIRVAEDRGIEPPTLIPLVRAWQNDKKGKTIYESMIDKFRELDSIYNSSLFTEHPFEKWDESPGVTENVIEILQGKAGYYEYDFKVMPADVLGAVYENYLGHRLAQSEKGVTADKDSKKRKEQGIYYTPEFIVDYIVKNTLKPVLDRCRSIDDIKRIKVLDPACGSGSFLIKALEVINDKYKEFGNKGDEYTKITILLENIYGVDLDEQAVEIARLNLLLSALETRMKLPKLDKNIKNGNSLISGSNEELEKYFGKNYRDKKPFNCEEKFPEVFKQGGFDVIIGNPPRVTTSHKELGAETVKFFKDKYAGAEGFKLNLFPLFVELGLTLLAKDGIVSLIIPNRLLDTPSYRGVRLKFINKYEILNIQNIPSGSFNDVVAGNIILTIQKTKNKSQSILISNFRTQEELILNINEIIENPNLTININTKPSSLVAIQKIKNAKNILLKDICDIHVGMMVKEKKEKFVDEPIYKYAIVVGKDLSPYIVKNKSYFDIDNIEIFGGTKNRMKHSQVPKLLVRKTGNVILCSLDTEGLFAEQSVYLVLLRNTNFNIKFICALLNSKLITFYFQNELITNPQAYPYIQHYDLESIPIIDVDNTKQEALVNYCDKILELKKQLIDESENSNKWESLKSEIEKTDRRINEAVYELYGLTEEETKIIEES